MGKLIIGNYFSAIIAIINASRSFQTNQMRKRSTPLHRVTNRESNGRSYETVRAKVAEL